MKTNILTNMKQYTKVFCAVLMLTGMSVNAWGETITLKVWNHSTGAYYDYGTFEKGSKPGEEPMLYDGVYSYYSVIAWAPGEQTDIVHPNNSGADYYGQYAWPNANYNGEATTLYAVYYCQADGAGDYDFYWTTKPSVQVMSCESQGVIVSDESDEDSQIGYYGTLTSFDLTYMSDGSGAVTWSSTNTDVATVVGDGSDGATVTVVGAGSANIKATVAKDATYCEGEGIYELLIEPIAPVVTNFTASCTNNTITIANENSSTVSNKGGLAITRYGYLYSTSVSTPTFGASGVNDANVGTSDVTLNARWVEKNITGLCAGTTYYVRAYAYNGEEYGYSTVVTITTKCAVTYVGNGGTGTTIDTSSPYDKLSDVTVMANSFVAPDGKIFDHWAGSDSKNYNPGDEISDITADITLTAQWRAVSFTDAKFSCADWSITGPSGDIVFITSAASKTVRSQEAFHVTASGLPANTTLTFATFPVNTKFEFKKADGTAVMTDTYGAVNTDFYVFYTPSGVDTSDGLDEITTLNLSVDGEPRKGTLTTKTIIGRHLPADFVIAGKKDGKWYALPANFSEESTPTPVEIAVDNINDPSIAYTANTNIYNLYGQNSGAGGFLYNDGDSDGNPDGEKIKLGMKNNGSKPLFAFAPDKNSLKGDGTATVTNNIGKQYWWTLKQTNTSITNPQDAKYTMISSNNPGTLSIKNSPFVWGTYKSGVEELRLIPASSIVPTEAEIVAWGHHNAIVEVDKANAGGTGVAAVKVKAKLNSEESGLITLAETGTSKGSSTKYDHTVGFGDGIDFAANAGQMLTLEWYNSSDEMIAVSNIMVPTIVASNITINKANYSLKSGWNTEVHVLPGVTVTVDASAYDNSDVTIKELNIYPGATVNASAGTLKATTLVLRNGWDRMNGEKKYDVARLYITPTNGNLIATNAYADWYIDFDQYYPVAVPWEVDLSANDGSKIWYKNTKSNAIIGASGSVRLRYYDGASRAANTNTGVGENSNWKLYGEAGCEAIPDKLEPSKAYAMTAKRPTGKAFSIIRMPLTIPSAEWTAGGEKGSVTIEAITTHKDQVTVTAYGDENTPEYAKGWNFIANPYMSLHKGMLSYTDEGTIEYANIPDIDFKEYDQVPIVSSKLKPASGFLIQAPKSGTVTFGETNRAASVPSYRREVIEETMPLQRVYITLANDEAEDMMGILVGENYTAAYEANADLTKLLSDGNTLRTYMYYGEQNMAYLAINPILAQEWIPVRVRIPVDGEYTFSLDNASMVENLEGVYLIDYANGDQVTNLIEENYTFYSEGGSFSGRFAINAIVGERQTPTAIDIIGGDENSNEPIKFIYHDNVYIWHNGVIYDATGKKVREIK